VEEPTPEVSVAEVGVEEESSRQTRDTFSRAADWLRRLGKIRDEDEVPPRQSATIGETVQAARAQALAEPAPGEQTMALPLFDEDLSNTAVVTRPSSRGQRRFVMRVADGRQFTLGDIPGGIGRAEDHGGEGDEPWQWVYVPGEESVDLVHLYFGSENGVLWVSDQNTAFGTVVVEPGQEMIRCVPGEKYFVIRGSEIRLGGLQVTIH
jgi:hypothetical protein